MEMAETAAPDSLQTIALAVGALVRDHSRLVFRIAYSVLRDHHDAEDATQEIFLRVLRYQKQLGKVADVKAWVASIAWRVAVDRAKAKARSQGGRFESLSPGMDEESKVREIADPGASAEDLAAKKQMHKLMAKMIASLPEEIRAPLLLSTVEELTSGQIAAVLGIPEGTVRTRLMRARATLKEKLAIVLGDSHV